MCGISGIISLDNARPDYGHLMNMTAVMGRRGPDGEGYMAANDEGFSEAVKRDRPHASVVGLQHRQHIGFGHCRLSITDLSPLASQPMCDAEGRLWIVFNGQIYNHVELRRELEAMGHRFKTHHSDTEVILNAYRQWGIKCLDRLNGTWAFCLWDSEENSIFMARDRVGVRPLFYAIHEGKFYFASQLNAILTNPRIRRELNEFAVYDYLTYTNVPAPSTIFKNIHKMPAAHYLHFSPGETPGLKRYWTPVDSRPELRLSEAELLDEIRNRLCEATHTQMTADVKAGMLLSGGLDSSVILACMSKYSTGPVSTFTVGFENNNGYRNEFEHARRVAALFKADYQELMVTEADFFDFLPQLFALQDEPVNDPANVPIHFISRLAKQQGVKVLLCGEGSDELFVGYEHWRMIYGFEKVFRQRPKLAALAAFVHKHSLLKHRGPHYQVWAGKVKNSWPVFWGGTELRTEEDKHGILSRDFLSRIGSYNSLEAVRDVYNHFTSVRPYQTFGWMTASDLQHRLPDQLLARLDDMMMSASIEGRHPFLDTSLIDLVMRIPPGLKIKQKTEKYLLKKAFEDVLPREIVYRSKDSFTVPLNGLFTDARKKEYMQAITDFNKDTGMFTSAYIKQLESPKKLKDFWNLLNLALWHKQHK